MENGPKWFAHQANQFKLWGIKIELVFKPCLGAVQDAEATDLRIPATGKKAKKEYVIDELQKFTEYRLWMKAGTSVGDGPRSYPVLTKTDEDGKKCTALFYHFSFVLVHSGFMFCDQYRGSYSYLTNPNQNITTIQDKSLLNWTIDRLSFGNSLSFQTTTLTSLDTASTQPMFIIGSSIYADYFLRIDVFGYMNSLAVDPFLTRIPLK